MRIGEWFHGREWRWWADKFCFGIVFVGLTVSIFGAFSVVSAKLARASAVPQSVAVVQQKLDDTIQSTHDTLTRIDRRVTKLEDSQAASAEKLASLDAKATTTLAQQDKMIDALWTLAIGIISLFGEVLVRRVFDRRKAH